MDYLDFHADTLTELVRGDLYRNSGNVDLQRAEEAFSSYAQVFALWRDVRGGSGSDAEFKALYDRAILLLKQQDSRLRLCRSAPEMERALAEGKSAAFLSVEDLEAAGRYAGCLREMDVSFVMLTWNYANSYGTGAVADQRAGLTPRGREAVRALDRQGIVLDVSHLSDAGFWDLCELTDRPVIASHSNCRRICGQARNLTDEQIREIIRRGGIIGLNFFPPFLEADGAATLESAERHLEHLLELGGEACAAMGCDFDGCDGALPREIRGIQDVPRLAEHLAARNYPESLLRRIFSENGKAFIRRAFPESGTHGPQTKSSSPAAEDRPAPSAGPFRT